MKRLTTFVVAFGMSLVAPIHAQNTHLEPLLPSGLLGEVRILRRK